MPAGATFKKLHDVIQNTYNFQSGYPNDPCHLYEFTLGTLVVTNDEARYLQHKDYCKNKTKYENKLKRIPKKFKQFEINHQERLKVAVRTPSSIKIDQYLEALKELDYIYDFGDYWQFIIKLENTVEDYYFGFPTLLDGAENAPPEDVGGITGYYDFLRVYENKNDPEHKKAIEWINECDFDPYDPIKINRRIEKPLYKKTEWDKINHKNHKVIKDKYRRGEM